MQSSTKPRIAIIGCGGMGRAHAQALLRFDGFDLVAAADPFPDPRAAMKKVADSIQFYDDTNKMLERERPDLVIVATSSMYHHDLVIAALKAGAHVLCEKPFSVSLAEADQMLAVARATGRMLLIDHQFRINPRVQAPLRWVREGKIGDSPVFTRGEPDEPGATVPRGFVSGIHVADAPTIPGEQSGRAQLAQWVASKSNP